MNVVRYQLTVTHKDRPPVVVMCSDKLSYVAAQAWAMGSPGNIEIRKMYVLTNDKNVAYDHKTRKQEKENVSRRLRLYINADAS